MPDCDYCGESFSDEDSHLDHLAAEHRGELGAIDKRRVASHEGGGDGGGFPLGPAILVGLLVFAGAVVVFVTFNFGGDGTASAGSLPDSGDQSVVSQVETEPATSNQHVSRDTDIDYERIPPTSGPHYRAQHAVGAGFYSEERPLGGLVHSVEHGAVVVYYDPAAITDEAQASLNGFASNFTGRWQSFIAVPNPADDPNATFVLTAWEKRLTMNEYDEDTVRAFMAEFIGRGPEQSVR